MTHTKRWPWHFAQAFSLLLLLVCAASTAETFTHTLTFQGGLLDAGGKPIPDGSYPVEFAIYGAETGGTALWQETQTVTQTGGSFTVPLGAVKPFPADLFGGDRWLAYYTAGGQAPGKRVQIERPRSWIYADDSDRVNGRHAGNSKGQVAVSNDARCVGLNADKVDGYHAGNSSGQVTVSNGTLCANLNAEMLGGRVSSGYAFASRVFVPPGWVDPQQRWRTIPFPDYQPFVITISELYGTPQEIAFLYCAENDYWLIWLGFDGRGNHVTGGASLWSQNLVLTLKNGRIRLKTLGDGSRTFLIESDFEEVKATVTW